MQGHSDGTHNNRQRNYCSNYILSPNSLEIVSFIAHYRPDLTVDVGISSSMRLCLCLCFCLRLRLCLRLRVPVVGDSLGGLFPGASRMLEMLSISLLEC